MNFSLYGSGFLLGFWTIGTFFRVHCCSFRPKDVILKTLEVLNHGWNRVFWLACFVKKGQRLNGSYLNSFLCCRNWFTIKISWIWTRLVVVWTGSILETKFWTTSLRDMRHMRLFSKNSGHLESFMNKKCTLVEDKISKGIGFMYPFYQLGLRFSSANTAKDSNENFPSSMR